MDWRKQLGRNRSGSVDPSEGSAFCVFVDSGGWGLEPQTGAGRRLYHQENLERCKGFFCCLPVGDLIETRRRSLWYAFLYFGDGWDWSGFY